jgi:hypothetical protein
MNFHRLQPVEKKDKWMIGFSLIWGLLDSLPHPFYSPKGDATARILQKNILSGISNVNSLQGKLTKTPNLEKWR